MKTIWILVADSSRAKIFEAEGRMLGVREIEIKSAYSREDERDLTMMGFVAFLDPPKDSAADAIQALNANGVAVKILTGDNDTVTRNVCRQVGIQF